MIQFDALKFDLDKNLIIQVSVPDKEYFEDVSISGIYIDTYKSYSASGPSNNPVYKYEVLKDSRALEDNILYENSNDLPELEETDEPNYDIPVDSIAKKIGKDSEGRVKYLNLVIPSTDILYDINGTVFFVWATTTGQPTFDTPCGLDIPQKVQWVIDVALIYNLAIPLLKNMECNCNTNMSFSNLFLRYKAFLYSMNIGDYVDGMSIWNKYFSKAQILTSKKDCGCYGKSI